MASQNQEVLRRLKSDHYLDNIGLLFKSLYSNDNLADVTISCRDGPTIEAHKIVLSACSSYFHELLSKKTSHPVFIMHKISYQDMLYLLEFMYKGVIDVPEDNVDHLIRVAKELEITDFCLPENNQPLLEQTSLNAIKKRKLNNNIESPPTIEVVSLSGSSSNLRKSISERSTSDVNENQTSSLSRNTRFKGKKRVPVCETIDMIDNIDISPRSSPKKKTNNNISNKNLTIQHSTPINKNESLCSSFVIRDVSGGNGSIVFNYKNGKDITKLSTNTTASSSVLPIPTPQSSNFTVKISPDDILDIETVTPDIEIENDMNPISLDDSNTEIGSFETNPDKGEVTSKEIKLAKFKCEICKKRFYRESQLYKHRKTAHAGYIRKLFACKNCDQKFSRRDKLKMHIENMHEDYDYLPKSERKKRLYGNPIEASATELTEIEQSNNPTSVTQSIIQSIKNITSPSTTENAENVSSNTIDTSQNTSQMSSGKRGRGRPPKERSLFVQEKEPRPKGRPRKFIIKQEVNEEKKPVGRPRKYDSPPKIKVIGRKPGRPRKSERSIIDENQSKSNVSIRSGDNYDGASLPYGDLSYLTSGLINHAGDSSSSSTTVYNNPLTNPLKKNDTSLRPMTPVDTKPEPPPILVPNTDIMTLIPPIKSECNTTITPIITTPTPPILEPIIPFQNDNITITQIPPLFYLKTAAPSSLNISSTSSLHTSNASSSAEEQSGPINMKKIGDCTIRPIT